MKVRQMMKKRQRVARIQWKLKEQLFVRWSECADPLCADFSKAGVLSCPEFFESLARLNEEVDRLLESISREGVHDV